MSSSQRATSGSVSPPGRLTAMPSAIVSARSTRTGSPRRSDSGNAATLSTWTPMISTSGRARLDREGDPAGQSAAADRHDDLRQVGDVLEQLETERALPGDDVEVVEGVHEGHPGLVGAGAGRLDGVVDRRARGVDDRPERGAPLGLGERRARGHEDLARDAAHTRGMRQRPGVVAGAARGDPAGAAVAERRELAQRAADLERARPLQALGLEHDLAARALGHGERGQHRRVADDVGGHLARAEDVVEAERAGRRGHGPQSARATIASTSTWLPSGSAATPIVVRAGGSDGKKAP